MMALLSVSDKTGLIPFARDLVALGFRLLSTGGTFQALREARIPVTAVSEYTGQPEILGGRVKTLHPKIHGGILARLEHPEDLAELEAHQIQPIELVVVNLYPFRETVSREHVSFEEAVEQIDIGGPSMVRAAAKNASRVTVIVDPKDYPSVLDEWKSQKSISSETRRKLMVKAFSHTAAYDSAIASWLCERDNQPFPQEMSLSFQKVQDLRYGENPHQRGAFYREYREPTEPTVAFSKVLQGKELSYNNILDLDAALGLVLEFSNAPSAVIIKHNSPCGVSMGGTIEEAYRLARQIDEVSAFGGIVALNRPVDLRCAKALAETFLEAVVAPAYSSEALAHLSEKKNLRLLVAGDRLSAQHAAPRSQMDVRSVSGGILVMDRDAREPISEWKVVTKRQPTDSEWASMRFAWKVCKHVKSNAIVFSSDRKLISVGGGQTSRVDSVRIAVSKGGEAIRGSAVASDAFFPFRDGVEAALQAGASCVVQPGGSVRDHEIIAAADEYGACMVFTGVRHFRH